MSYFKKFICIFTTIFMSFSLLTACSSASSTEDLTTEAADTSIKTSANDESTTINEDTEINLPAYDGTSDFADGVALTVNGEDISASQLNVIYTIIYNRLADSLGNSASYYGLDLSTGKDGLADQSCTYSSDGTWKGYILEQAVSNVQQMKTLHEYADENGITYSDNVKQQIEDELTEFENKAKEEGYANADEYAEVCFGNGVTEATYEWYLNESNISTAAYNSYFMDQQFSDEEIAGHYEDMGYDEGENDYATVSMRHILIMAEADENGEYSDEAIEAAHKKAEEIYKEWQEGEATEESFAELAKKYSNDSSSNTNGGLYENIYKDGLVSEINDFVFDERQYGDTIVVDHSGTYTGSHIIFFVGNGEIYSTYLSLEDLRSNATKEWLSARLETVITEYGDAFDQVG